MKPNKLNRYSHAGKNLQEKEAYRNFLSSKFLLDKTEEGPVDTGKSNESAFEEDEGIKQTGIQKKSKWLKIKDFLYDNWVIALVSGATFLLVGGYVAMNRELGVHGEKLDVLKNDVDLLKDDNKSFGTLRNDFSVFKAEVSKDLEYIKRKIKL